jgi:hypothetical protein
MGRGNRKKNKKGGNVAIINTSDTEAIDVEQKFSYTTSEKTVSKKSQQNIKEKPIQITNIENIENIENNNTNRDNLHKQMNYVDKMIYVDKFVNSFWERIYVSEEIEDIIIENVRDNDLDDFYDEY